MAWRRVLAVCVTGGGGTNDPGFDFELGHNRWVASFADSTTTLEALLGQESALTGRWVQVAAVVDRTALTITPYIDGVALAPAGITMPAMRSSSPDHSPASRTPPARRRSPPRRAAGAMKRAPMRPTRTAKPPAIREPSGWVVKESELRNAEVAGDGEKHVGERECAR